MFGGSEHLPGSYIEAMERIGATDLNGTTSEDRTNYFENVPTSALEYALFAESDRMGHFYNTISQEVLDLQRGVVQNEKRQGDNQPYAIVEDLVVRATYPGRPSVRAHGDRVHGGSRFGFAGRCSRMVSDLLHAVECGAGAGGRHHCGRSRETGPPVFRRHPARCSGLASAVLGCKDDGRTSRSWCRTAFHRRVSTRSGTCPVTAPRLPIICAWRPSVLSSGKNSRLYKRLVYDDQIATQVAAYLDEREIGSQFVVVATASSGEDLRKVERVLDEELDRFLQEGPTERELQRVKTQSFAGFIRGVERIGGFGGKSDILASSQTYLGSPYGYREQLKRLDRATFADVQNVAREWLSEGVYTLEVVPFRETANTQPAKQDRERLPEIGPPHELEAAGVSRKTGFRTACAFLWQSAMRFRW